MQSKTIDANENFIYYNAQLTGNTRTGADELDYIEANYNDTSTTPILEKIEDYNLSIVRFKIPAPPYIFDFGGTTNSQYFVGMILPGVLVVNPTVDLIFENWDLTIINSDQFFFGVYPIVAFQQFCNMINTALATCLIAAKVLDPSITVDAPYFVFNSDTQKFELRGESAWATTPNACPTIVISNAIYQRIPTIPANYYDNATWKLRISPNTGLNVNVSGSSSFVKPPGQAVGDFFVITQQSLALASMFDAQGLYLTTTMPVKAESLPQSSISNGQASNNFIRVITDFEIDYSSGEANEPYLQNYITYNLQNTNTRKIQFIGQGPLTNIEFQVFWYDRYNNLFPIYVSDGQIMNVKFQFTKRKEIKYPKI